MSRRTYRGFFSFISIAGLEFFAVQKYIQTHIHKVISNTPLGLSNWVRGLLLCYGSSLNLLARLLSSSLAR